MYELLGVAHATLGRRHNARRAFDFLLLIDPTHAIPYTLGAKVTHLFEEARSAAAERRPPSLLLGWQRGLRVQDPVQVTVETSADPASFLTTAVIYARTKGTMKFLTTKGPKNGSPEGLLFGAMRKSCGVCDTGYPSPPPHFLSLL